MRVRQYEYQCARDTLKGRASQCRNNYGRPGVKSFRRSPVRCVTSSESIITRYLTRRPNLKRQEREIGTFCAIRMSKRLQMPLMSGMRSGTNSEGTHSGIHYRAMALHAQASRSAYHSLRSNLPTCLHTKVSGTEYPNDKLTDGTCAQGIDQIHRGRRQIQAQNVSPSQKDPLM